jgi:elongation factor G
MEAVMASAKEFPTGRIRNVAVLGHAGSGKTSLVDALCFAAGSSRRRGRVEDGQALTLTTPEEVAHRVSMQLTPAHAEWLDTRINLLDTPGYLDFNGEARAAVRVADAAILVLGATEGVQVGTERMWEFCEERGIPRILFVSMMDRDRADFMAVYRDIREHLTERVIPVEIPVGAGDGFSGIINLFSERTHRYRTPDGKGEYDEEDVPAELAALFEEWETELQETLATTDENLLEEYLVGGRISREQALEAMARAMRTGEVVPLFCGSAHTGYGMRALLRKMVELFPSPAETGRVEARRPELEHVVELSPDAAEPVTALVFKTTSEPHVGALSYLRVFSGTLRNGSEMLNPRTGAREKVNHLAIPHGKDRLPVEVLHAGDIGVVTKLRDTMTNDTLCDPERALVLEPIEFPRPEVSVAVTGRSRADEDRLGEALSAMAREDPTFVTEYDPELRQTLMRGVGELHLEIQLERMKRRYGIDVETSRPRVAYRETLRGPAEARGRFKKQTGGRGQFGDCRIRIEPRPRGTGYEFVNSIKGGVIPGKYIPSVDRGIQEAAERGILAGFPVVDFQAECVDGSFHPVDSSDIAFKVAGSMAFRNAAAAAGLVLLEPIIEVAVTTPDENTGDILADLTQRRGRIMGMLPRAGQSVIRALVPEAELYRYAAGLRSMTQGRAHHTRTFTGYEAVPEAVAGRIVEERAGGATA